ncbi:MAG: NADH-quinone oxidoreductase subunit J [Terriglobales bacterium]
MPVLFAFGAIIAIFATIMAITRMNAFHALLWLVPSLLAVAVAIYALGAPYLAALEVIIYAGAIMVLFIFVSMMLNLGQSAEQQERTWQPGRGWVGPSILGGLLFAAFLWSVLTGAPPPPGVHRVGPHAVGRSLLTTYILGVELASMLLMGAVIAAYHIGSGVGRRQTQAVEQEPAKKEVTTP